MIKHGYLGFFSSITELENKFPAAKFPGNSASINVFGETLHYVSSGTSWNPVNAFTSTEVAAVQSLVSGYGVFGATDPLTVMCGNSIPGYSRYNIGGWYWAQGSELMYARRFAGGARMRFKKIAEDNAATKRHDMYGNYSYAGATATQIVDEWIASGGWFDSLDAKGLRPDLVVIPDIILNDITGTATGTLPTGYSHGGPNAANSCVATANGDSTTLVYTGSPTSNFQASLDTALASGLSIADTVALTASARVEILSGAQYLRSLQLRVDVTYSDASTNQFQEMTQLSGGNDASYRDGDVVDLMVPDFYGAAGKTISSIKARLYTETSVSNVGAVTVKASRLGAFYI